MFNQFINRKKELQHLNFAYNSDRSEFIVVFGRRRIGKTELLRQFIKEKHAMYFLADERGDAANLSEFRTLVAEKLGNELFRQSILDWPDTLKEAARTCD